MIRHEKLYTTGENDRRGNEIQGRRNEDEATSQQMHIQKPYNDRIKLGGGVRET